MTMTVIGVIGYLLTKLKMPMAPLVLGVVLGNLMEQNLRRALSMTNGDPVIFFSSTVTLVPVGAGRAGADGAAADAALRAVRPRGAEARPARMQLELRRPTGPRRPASDLQSGFFVARSASRLDAACRWPRRFLAGAVCARRLERSGVG
jgi:hypothetical protein